MKGDAVPLEDDGINLEVLEAKLKLLPDKPVTERHPFKAAVYVIPVYQNPTGICYSSGNFITFQIISNFLFLVFLEKCQKLVELARKYDLLVIADDIYNLLTYKTLPGKEDTFESSPARLFTYDNESDVGYKGQLIIKLQTDLHLHLFNRKCYFKWNFFQNCCSWFEVWLV